MALKAFVLPVCDVCGKAWLPEEGPARDDPRAFDRKQRADGNPPLRCGKCKSIGWDRNYTGDRRRKNPHELQEQEASKPPKKRRVGTKSEHRTPRQVSKRCRKHRLLHCAQCHSVSRT